MKNKPLSASAIKTFLQCPLKFFLHYYTDKEPIRDSGDALYLGTALHKALEVMYKLLPGGKRPTKEDYDKVIKTFIETAIKEGMQDQSLYEEGKSILRKRLDTYNPNEKVIGLEIKFGFRSEGSVDVSTKTGVPLIGAIDKLIELDKDTIVVVDYKSSKMALTDDEAAIDEQLSMYDMVVSTLYPQYSKRILVLDYLRLDPVITYRTTEQRNDFEMFVDSVYSQITEMTKQSAKPRLNEFCSWCDYKSYCPKYDKMIKDPDLLSTPFGELTDSEFLKTWVDFAAVKKVIEGYYMRMKMHMEERMRKDNSQEIHNGNSSIYKVQRSMTYYDVRTVFNTVPPEDFLKLVSVKKNVLDKYLVENPEYEQPISDTARVSFTQPQFRHRKGQ